ncbi:MAG: hypothetical protein M3O71_10230 [Bacteroidota bacterium]|nr:hypothetical protein [Bacteroidota bacterium]
MEKSRYGAIDRTKGKHTGRYTHEHNGLQAGDKEISVNPPSHGSYGGLLFDPRWKAKRQEIMTRDKECCVICQGTNELQVHHRQYQYIKAANAFKVPWDYADHLLITVCKSCHQRGHNKFKVPILII